MRLSGGAGNRDDVLPFVQQPGQRQLGRRAADFLGDGFVRCQQLQVRGIVVGRKARHGAADIFGVQRADIVQFAAQKPARHRAEGDKRNAQFTTGVQHGNFGVARPERILGLQGGDGVYGMRAAQRGGGHFAQAKGANLAGGHQLGQRADAVLNRHLLVPAVQVIQVNHVGLQALERGFAGGANGFWPAINDTH